MIRQTVFGFKIEKTEETLTAQAELINELEGDDVLWTITADQDSAVRTLITSIPDAAWQEAFPGAGYELAETIHRREKTKQAFRLVVKREERRQPNLFDGETYFHYAVATNAPETEGGDGPARADPGYPATLR